MLGRRQKAKYTLGIAVRLVALASCGLLALPLGLAFGQSLRRSTPVFPSATWPRVPTPEQAGFSPRGLDSVLTVARRLKTSALMVVVGGRSLLEYGDVAETSYVASVRKSVLSMLYGRYVENGTIRLDKTLKQLRITDKGSLLPIEEEATVENLLGARSGVYHIASYPGDQLDSAPPRGSQKPGTYQLYSNWDFNVLGTIFEQETGRNIYDALETDLARPMQMQDFYRAGQHKDGDTTRSIHLAYPFVLSTRDMARLGYLMLRDGNWNGRQVVPRTWVRLTTRLVTPTADMYPVSSRPFLAPTGYGWLWWIEDRPDTADALHGAYSARGAFGQYIWVIPKLDMVVAHKVVIRRGVPRDRFVRDVDMKRILQAIIAARCGTRCRTGAEDR